MQTADTSHPKLQVFDVVEEVLKGSVAHFSKMVGIVWLPGILVLSAVLIPRFLLFTDGLDDDFAHQVRMWGDRIYMLSFLILWPMIAVAWHRFILLGESKSAYLRFGMHELKFVGALVMVAIPGIVLPLLATAFFETTWRGIWLAGVRPEWTLDHLGTTLIWLLGWALGFRLSLLLPAVALGENFSPLKAWTAMRGNFWRLSVAMVMVLAIAGVFGGIPAMIAGFVLPYPLAFVPVIVWGIFMELLTVATLSVAYKELVIAPSSQTTTQ